MYDRLVNDTARDAVRRDAATGGSSRSAPTENNAPERSGAADRFAPSAVAEAVLAHGFAGADACGVALAVLATPDELAFIATSGVLVEAHAGRSLLLGITEDSPMTRAVTTRGPVALPDRPTVVRRFPRFAAIVGGAEAAIALPVVTDPARFDASIIGAIGVVFTTPQPFDDAQIDALRTLAQGIGDLVLRPLAANCTDARSRARSGERSTT